jgi:hypothetical protein
MKEDKINKPKHYAYNIEPLDVIEDWNLNFCLGNVIKYIARADRKGNRLEDLQKAEFYIQRELTKNGNDNRQKQNTGRNQRS